MPDGKSNSETLDRLIREYLGSDDMREKVSRAADAANLAIHAELAPYQDTGELSERTGAVVHEFAQGYGLRIATLWYQIFVANNQGFTRNRTSFRRGIGMKRKKGWKISSPVRHASEPVFLKTALWAMDDVFAGESDL